jgi:hypothetical protein
VLAWNGRLECSVAEARESDRIEGSLARERKSDFHNNRRDCRTSVSVDAGKPSTEGGVASERAGVGRRWRSRSLREGACDSWLDARNLGAVTGSDAVEG